MINVLRFVFNPFQENTYLIWNDSGDCAIIDPGCLERSEENLIREAIAERGLKPKMLLNTHCHIDHVFGNAFAAKEYGLKPVIHRDEAPVLNAVPAVASMYGLPYVPSPEPAYYDDDHLFLGDDRFEVIHVPGHSPGHVALYGKADGILISGDVLFKRSIGRADLPGGDMDTLLRSISERLMVLPEETKVYPGHMEETTIGEEKRFNPFLKESYQG
jgi:glyoxylase-like metal-dependent hydrolase (beta-lactamase superfamily II)